MSVEGASFVSRVVEILADNGEEATVRWTTGSGLLVGGRNVLTSAHVLTSAQTVYVRAMRYSHSVSEGSPEAIHEGPGAAGSNALTKQLWRASIMDGGDPATVDVALLQVLDGSHGGADDVGDLPPLRFAQVDRQSDLPQVIQGCSAVGFPRFMVYDEPGGSAAAGSVRETAQVSGEIPTLDRLVSGLLTLRVKSSPRPLPPLGQLIPETAWSGMSGAVVIVDDVVIGVVTEHFPRAGDSQLTVTPITHVGRLPTDRRTIWQQALGIDLTKLPAYQACLVPIPSLVKPSRNIVIAALIAALLGGSVAGVLAGQFEWGITFATMTLAAVVCGNAGIKLLRVSSALENQQRRGNAPSSLPANSTPPTTRTVDITAAHNIAIKGSVIAAGDVRQTNIRLGGFAALALTGVLALAGSIGTAAISIPTDTPESHSPLALRPTDVAVVLPTGVSKPGVWSCPPAQRIGSNHVALLAGETTFAQLTLALRGMQMRGGQVNQSATALVEAVERLSPPPTTSAEALGRLRFSGSDIDATLASLNSAVAGICGNPEFTEGQLSYFREKIRPRPVSGGVLVGDVYGQCGMNELGWIAPFTQVIDCRDGTVAAVDMTTGTVRRLTGLPSGPNTGLKLAGDKLVWATIATQPAQGLNEETWQATLHIQDLRTGNKATTVADEGKAKAPEASNVVLGGWPDRILVSTGQKFRMVDATGNTLWRSTEYAGHGFDRPTASTLWIDPLLVDLNTGASIRDYGPADLNNYFAHNGCGNSAVMPDYRDGVWLTESAAGQLTVRALSVEFNQKVNILKATTGTLVNMDSGSGLHGVNLNGTETWNISRDIAMNHEILGRWIVVTNPSGNKVLVDAATGNDMTSAQASVADILFRVGDRLELAHADPRNDLALVRGDANGGIVLRSSWSAICA